MLLKGEDVFCDGKLRGSQPYLFWQKLHLQKGPELWLDCKDTAILVLLHNFTRNNFNSAVLQTSKQQTNRTILVMDLYNKACEFIFLFCLVNRDLP